MAIPLKNATAIARMRESCAIASTVLYKMRELVAPGITTYDLDQEGKNLIEHFGARSACFGYQIGSRRFPAYTCISVNEEVVHGIGSLKRVLQDGDLVCLDVVISFNGFIGDNALTVAVGRPSPEGARLLQVTEEALVKGIAQATVSNRIGDVSHAIQLHAEAAGFGVVRDLVGHGVGASMHEEPQIPNFGRPRKGPVIRPGMTLAIEPMINLGTYRTKTLADGWTVVTTDSKPAAHFEHTVLTTDQGPEILTLPLADQFSELPKVHAIS